MAEQQLEETPLEEANKRVARLEKRLERERAARKQAESIAEQGMRDLFLANRGLDQQVADRTEQLNMEVQSSAKAAERRLLFLGALSRQVRTPLNGVYGMLELLANQDLDDQSMIWLESASDSAEDLLKLFTRLALYMELSDGEIKVSGQTKVRDLFDGLVSKWGKACLSAGQLLISENKVDGEMSLGLSKLRLMQLFDEIFDNVVRHSDQGPVNLEASREGDELLLTVTDNGPGIQDVTKRLESYSDTQVFTETLGMGYALIERLAEVLGVAVEQAGSNSTTISVRIPIDGGLK